jgi:adenylate kinase
MKTNASTCPYVILLSGTPGTGKTTISKSLSKQNGWEIFSLGDFIVDKKFYSSELDNRDAKIIDTEIAAKEGAREILTRYFASEVVVVDSHYADIILDGFSELEKHVNNLCVRNYAQRENIIGIVCRCHPNVLLERLAKRNYSNSKIMENIQAEILSESTQNLSEVLQEKKIIEIDTTNNSVKDISIAIIENFLRVVKNQVIRNDILQNVGITDWIVTLNEEGTLNSFFKEDFGEKFDMELQEFEEEALEGDKKK